MITLTKLDGVEFVLNCDMIETVYENPDTTIHLSNDHIYIVQESTDDILRKVLDFRKKIFADVLRGNY